jgi:hypothetical protein
MATCMSLALVTISLALVTISLGFSGQPSHSHLVLKLIGVLVYIILGSCWSIKDALLEADFSEMHANAS